MAKYRLTPRAERDLEEIWQYTVQEWSPAQGEKYVASLLNAMALLAKDPSRGRSAEKIRAGYRRRNVGTHVIFYKQTDDSIAIIRVLHQRMDLESQLEAE